MDLADDPPICVIGLGNLLERDDGFGPLAIQWLERHVDLPPEVELVDIGTAGLHLLTWVIGRRTVIFLDAMTAGAGPGEIRTFDRAAILGSSQRSAGPRISPHQPEVREILTMAEVAGGAPEDVLLIGVEPADMRDGLGLSPALEAALEPVARRVVEELERRGARCTWRSECAHASP